MGKSSRSDLQFHLCQSFFVSTKEIWLSDLRFAARKLESLRRGQTSLKSSRPDRSGSLGLDRLIEEGEEFAADLRDRSNGIENLDQFDPTRVASDAERKTLEDFLGYVEGIEEAFMVGKTEQHGQKTIPCLPF